MECWSLEKIQHFINKYPDAVIIDGESFNDIKKESQGTVDPLIAVNIDFNSYYTGRHDITQEVVRAIKEINFD